MTSADRWDANRDATAVDLYYFNYDLVQTCDVAPQQRRMIRIHAVDGVSAPLIVNVIQ